VLNDGGKTYATGSELGVKYSSGVLFTINLPANIVVDSVNFTGYDNYADVDSYLGELNGVSYGTTDYVYTQKDANGNYTICSHTVPLNTPASGTLPFKFQGKQVVMKITLYVRTSTGVDQIVISPLDPDGFTNVYSLNGSIIKCNVIRRYALEGLQTGVYIVDRQKYFVKY